MRAMSFLCGVVVVMAGPVEGRPVWELSEKDLPGIQPRVDFVDSQGRHIPPKALAQVQGGIQWTIEDADRVPAEARSRVQAGMQAGASNDLGKAMEHFQAAHRLAPRWAQPVYQGAWTALLIGDAALAEKLYAWTDRMVPGGYWTTKTALDCLRRERVGELPAGTYLQYVMLEGEPDSSRAQLLEQLVRRLPNLAPAWKDLAVLRVSPEGRSEAIERGLAARPDRETGAFLRIHKAQLLEERGAKEEARTLLKSILDPADGTLQTMALARLKLVLISGSAD